MIKSPSNAGRSPFEEATDDKRPASLTPKELEKRTLMALSLFKPVNAAGGATPTPPSPSPSPSPLTIIQPELPHTFRPVSTEPAV